MKFTSRENVTYIYPNKYGFLFTGCFFLCVMLGATYENNMLFLFGFILLAFLFVFILITAAEVKSVKVESVRTEPGFPSQTVGVKILLTNPSDKFVQMLVSADNSVKISSDLKPHESKIVEIPYQLPAKRGVHELRRLRLFTSGPLMFFNCWTYKYVREKLHVFPKPEGEALPHSEKALDIANINGLEEYTGRQSISRISWRHFARDGKLLVKSSEHDLLMNYTFHENQVEKLEKESALSQLSKWICDAEVEGTPYMLSYNHFVSSSATGKTHRNKLLLELAKVP